MSERAEAKALAKLAGGLALWLAATTAVFAMLLLAVYAGLWLRAPHDPELGAGFWQLVIVAGPLLALCAACLGTWLAVLVARLLAPGPTTRR